MKCELCHGNIANKSTDRHFIKPYFDNKRSVLTMEKHRVGETGKLIPPRCERFYSSRGEWYFTTREGSPVGPFDNKSEALGGLGDFIEFMALAKPKTLSRLYASLSA